MSTTNQKTATPHKYDYNARNAVRRWQILNEATTIYDKVLRTHKVSPQDANRIEGLYVDFINAPANKDQYVHEMNQIMSYIFGPSWKPVNSNNEGVKRLDLFDDDGNPLPIKGTKIGAVPKAYAHKATFNTALKFIAEEGPAFSKVAFMAGTMAETIYAGMEAGKPESATGLTQMMNNSGIVDVGPGQEHIWLITLIVWGMGLMYETAFGYAWYMTGSRKLAGKQVILNETMYNRCLTIMSCGLMAALVSALFNAQMILNIWLIFQVLGTVSILRLQRLIKRSHPLEIERQKNIDREARQKAAWMAEQGHEMDLYLEKTKSDRVKERKKLGIKKAQETKVLDSKEYRRSIYDEVYNELMPYNGAGGDGWRSKLGKLLPFGRGKHHLN